MSKRAEKKAAVELRRYRREDRLADKKSILRMAINLTEAETELAKRRHRLAGIEAALKERGLFAFEHVDGTFTIVDR